MTPKEYNEIKDPDTKLTVRLAVTMGWEYVKATGKDVEVRERWFSNEYGYPLEFNPFTDASIPYGLIGRGVDGLNEYEDGGFSTRVKGGSWFYGGSKTHTIINAYCQADPMRHWAAFTGDSK